MGNGPRTRPGRSLFRLYGGVAVGILLAATAAGGYLLIRAVNASAQAEADLHVTQFAFRLVERFVADRGHWPRSWEELEAFEGGSDPPTPGRTAPRASGVQPGYDWPAAAPEVRRRVAIDFAADPTALAAQDPESFTAIRPNAPGFDHSYAGDAIRLQATLRRVTVEKGGDGR